MENNLVKNIDYYLDEFGNMVFTEAYHLKRGICCGSGCRHCPYKNRDPNVPQEFSSNWSNEFDEQYDEENEDD